MRTRGLLALTLLLSSGAAFAERQPGWDFGGELIYAFSKDINFEGGSNASLEDDIGLALSFNYRFTPRLELMIGLDWNAIDYDVHIAPGDAAAGLGFDATGELEYWTPRVGVNFNFMDRDFTPYVTGAIGWAFIDTNIPDGPAVPACWWDPWWGYYCGVYQTTRSIDEFVYDIGAGVRWDVSDTITLRFAYERHWLDLGEATSTPGFDQVKFGISGRY